MKRQGFTLIELLVVIANYRHLGDDAVSRVQPRPRQSPSSQLPVQLAQPRQAFFWFGRINGF
jgi:hypothetical protein